MTITADANQAPDGVATALPTSGKAPLTVAFSSAGSADTDGTIVVYSWAFGDGGTSTAAEPSPHLHDGRRPHRDADGHRRQRRHRHRRR